MDLSLKSRDKTIDVPRYSPMIMKAAKVPAMVPDTNGSWVPIEYARDLWNAVQVYKQNVSEVSGSVDKFLKELPELRAEKARLLALLEAADDAKERAIADLRAYEASMPKEKP